MERQSGYNNLPELTSSNFYGNVSDVSSVRAVDDSNHQQFMNHPNPLVLPQWFHRQTAAPPNYFQFLTENSSFLEKASTPDVIQNFPQFDSGAYFVEGFSNIYREILYNNLGNSSYPDMDSLNLKPHSCMLNSANSETSSNVRCLNPHNQVVNQLESSQYQSQAQCSWKQKPSEEVGNVSHIHPRISVSPSVFVPKKQGNVARSRVSTDRLRRIRIAERVKALKELLPHSVEGSQVAALDDVIHYIEYLQLQMKELSQSRLGGESTSGPFLFVEGYGHYIVLEQMMNETLEEMMGKLMEENPDAATKLLESKGLYCGAHGLVDRLQQAM